MEEYRPNSNKYKNRQAEQGNSEKKVEKPVVSGKVKTKKKSGARKLADTFVSEDISTVKSYIIIDVLIPAAKKAISDIVTNGIDMLLYGEAGRSNRRSGGTKFNYGGCFDRPSEPRRAGSARRDGFDYDEIIFDSRGDAERVLEGMDAIIESYGRISVADLYDLADVTNTNFAANKYGWTDIHTARAVRVRDGYILNLPQPRPID